MKNEYTWFRDNVQFIIDGKKIILSYVKTNLTFFKYKIIRVKSCYIHTNKYDLTCHRHTNICVLFIELFFGKKKKKQNYVFFKLKLDWIVSTLHQFLNRVIIITHLLLVVNTCSQ